MDNQEEFVKELKIANENILKLTLVLEHYTKTTNEKLTDYKERFIELEEDNETHSERIRDLERSEEGRQKREDYIIKILYGTVASVLMMVAKSVWELITKK